MGGTDGAQIGPAATLTASAGLYSNVSPLPVTIAWNRSVTGFTLSDLSVTNGTLQNFSGSGATYTVEVVASSEGAVRVTLAAESVEDSSGNSNEASAEFLFYYDITQPSVTIARHPAQTAFTETLPITFTIQFSEPMSTTTFTTATFTQSGRASGVTWTLNNSGDNQNFTLVASAITGGAGSLNPSLIAGAVSDRGGNTIPASAGSYAVEYLPNYLSTKLWLRADSLSAANGAPITSWTDLSPSANTPTEVGSPPSFVTAATNGLPAVRFNGASRLTTPSNTNVTGNPDLSLMVVTRVLAVGVPTFPAFLQLGSAAADGASAWFGLESTTNNPYSGFYNGGSKSAATLPADFAIYTWIRNSGSGSNNAQTGNSLYLNGTAIATSSALNPVSVNLTNGPILVGRSTNLPIQADIAEAIVFSGVALSTSNRILIENYLNAKYSLY